VAAEALTDAVIARKRQALEKNGFISYILVVYVKLTDMIE
jgi:hypothetical protein